MKKLGNAAHWFIRIMGLSCLLMLITGISKQKGFVEVDILMIAIWIVDEYYPRRNR